MSKSGNLNEKEIYEYQKSVSANSRLFISDKNKCRYYDWHRGFCYVGTKSQLIAEGLAQDGWFPGDSGNNKTTLKVVFNDSLEAGVVRNNGPRMQSSQRFIEITRTGSRDEKFKIIDMFPKSIKAEYDSARRKEWESEKELSKAQEEYKQAKIWEQYQLEQRVNTIGEARSKVSHQYELISTILNGTYHELCDSGYVQTDNYIKRLNDVLEDLSEVFAEVTFKHNPHLRVRANLKLKHKTAKTDFKFSQFLNGVTQSNVELGE
jgi:hypothetical protein